MPVLISHLPLPSILSSRLMSVSLVFLSTDETLGFDFRNLYMSFQSVDDNTASSDFFELKKIALHPRFFASYTSVSLSPIT